MQETCRSRLGSSSELFLRVSAKALGGRSPRLLAVSKKQASLPIVAKRLQRSLKLQAMF